MILTWACDKAGNIGQSTLLIWYKITKHLNGAFSFSEDKQMTYDEYSRSVGEIDLVRDEKIKELIKLFWDTYGN